ncbi:MAG: preprotein translocase subunit SecG [Bacteroidota bacterium]
MSTFLIFLILIILIAFLLVVVIMVQNPKGGGLSSTFGGGGGQQIGGVKNTTNFLDKSTWTLAIILLALILFSNISLFDGRGTTNLLNPDVEATTLPAPDTNASTDSIP